MTRDDELGAMSDLSRVVTLLEEMNQSLRRLEVRQHEESERQLGQLREVRAETRHVGMMAAWCGLAALFFVVPQVIAWFR